MDEFDRRAFSHLLNAVVQKAFDHPLNSSLSESESKHLSVEIQQRTGLIIGWRSLKNYTQFLISPSPDKLENPSTATLDTLSRYILEAPLTTETLRKRDENHFPYWFRFREQTIPVVHVQPATPVNRKPIYFLTGIGIAALLFFAVGFNLFLRRPTVETVTDNFQLVSDSSLQKRGWFLQAQNSSYWNRSAETPGQLTLFTLKGDNWQYTGETPRIQNLLLRSVTSDCFRAEVHLTDFVPTANWQQAGLVLLEDTSFVGKSIRLSLAYNDFFGGYSKPAEILIQAVAWGNSRSHAEEFIHQPLFLLDSTTDRPILAKNLSHFAFRVEKRGQKFRILYSASPVDNFSFKEVTSYESDMKPNYIGLFALKGFVDSTAVVPVAIRFFQLEPQPCE